MFDITPPIDSKRPLPKRLTEADAIDIWIARWLRLRRKDILARYGCDSRRIYEVWEGTRHPASRKKAEAVFAARFPSLLDRVDFSHHRRISRVLPPDVQPGLFD
jgi:hypothetical protein